MLQRLYVHNFRCLQNFELNLKGIESALLIGKNGVGKSTILTVLELLQKISQGVNRMRDLLTTTDFSMGNIDSPIRIEIELYLEHKLYKYILACALPEKFK
jgi:predicted ATP-binding protein involved in virulence